MSHSDDSNNNKSNPNSEFGDEIESVGDESAPSALGQAEAEAARWKNDYLYLRAEFENYKKQMIKERSDLVKYGSERLLLALLDVLDIFDRALSSEIKPENVNGFVDGIRLTAEELRSVLSRFGVSGHDPVGEPFDPLMHEALSTEETDRYPPGHITQVFRRAYRLHDRVIRPAQVVVAKELGTKG